MSAARQLFEQFRQDGFAMIEKAVNKKWQEHIHLDFKTPATKTGALEKDDRRNYAEALSGFANSDGGVIVWGVDCRPNRSTKVDEAQSRSPIKNVDRFFSDLNTQLAGLVEPGVEGVEHHRINDADRPEDGYIITLVPKGEGLPHMAHGPDQHRYYQRIGASFSPMQHFQLADRFARRPQPKLEFAWKLPPPWTASGSGTTVYHFGLVMGIRNTGGGGSAIPCNLHT